MNTGGSVLSFPEPPLVPLFEPPYRLVLAHHHFKWMISHCEKWSQQTVPIEGLWGPEIA